MRISVGALLLVLGTSNAFINPTPHSKVALSIVHGQQYYSDGSNSNRYNQGNQQGGYPQQQQGGYPQGRGGPQQYGGGQGGYPQQGYQQQQQYGGGPQAYQQGGNAPPQQYPQSGRVVAPDGQGNRNAGYNGYGGQRDPNSAYGERQRPQMPRTSSMVNHPQQQYYQQQRGHHGSFGDDFIDAGPQYMGPGPREAQGRMPLRQPIQPDSAYSYNTGKRLVQHCGGIGGSDLLANGSQNSNSNNGGRRLRLYRQPEQQQHNQQQQQQQGQYDQRIRPPGTQSVNGMYGQTQYNDMPPQQGYQNQGQYQGQQMRGPPPQGAYYNDGPQQGGPPPQGRGYNNGPQQRPAVPSTGGRGGSQFVGDPEPGAAYNSRQGGPQGGNYRQGGPPQGGNYGNQGPQGGNYGNQGPPQDNYRDGGQRGYSSVSTGPAGPAPPRAGNQHHQVNSEPLMTQSSGGLNGNAFMSKEPLNGNRGGNMGGSGGTTSSGEKTGWD